MDGEVPCSSLAVDSVLRVGTAGVIWGLCVGPYDANKRGLTGIARASYVANSAGRFGSMCGQAFEAMEVALTSELFPNTGVFAGVFSLTRCGIQRYRNKNDWCTPPLLRVGDPCEKQWCMADVKDV
ncbi:hypothetical protein RHSIM_Rhsim01G0285300 [Rhododendron simsii]|uniref:Uncharacterized protein n=1 Tax=Rhododendron simsii TaxID=118357 RepID=A0A834LWI4_RHOSS|nr:hypothetical protein RHSIM_Rhsim01G0285300 [Rhododendron simsii]